MKHAAEIPGPAGALGKALSANAKQKLEDLQKQYEKLAEILLIARHL